MNNTALVLTVVFGLFLIDSANLADAAHNPDVIAANVHAPNQSNKISDTERAGRTTRYEYDAANRLIKTIYPDDTPLDDLDNTYTTTEYDKLGRKTGAYDQAREYTQYEYDPLGNLTAAIDTLNQYTRYGYDEQSNKISQTDAELNPTKWAYDNNGRVISRTLPLLQKEHYGHDKNGNRTSLIDFNAQGCASAEGTGCAGTANGDTTTYVYNDLNQQTEIHYFDGTSVITTYTATGQVDIVTDYRGPTDYDYDERERLSRILHPNKKGVTITIRKGSNFPLHHVRYQTKHSLAVAVLE